MEQLSQSPAAQSNKIRPGGSANPSSASEAETEKNGDGNHSKRLSCGEGEIKPARRASVLAGWPRLEK
jgi:hypothetical protein